MAGFSSGRGNVERDILQKVSDLEKNTGHVFQAVRSRAEQRNMHGHDDAASNALTTPKAP